MSNFRDDILKALELKLKGEIATHQVNIKILLGSHVGVAEHPDTIATIEEVLEKLATAQDKLNNLRSFK